MKRTLKGEWGLSEQRGGEGSTGRAQENELFGEKGRGVAGLGIQGGDDCLIGAHCPPVRVFDHSKAQPMGLVHGSY